MPLSVRLISGKDDSRRQRFLSDYLTKVQQRNWKLDRVGHGGLSASLSFWSLSDDNVAIVVEVSGKKEQEAAQIDINLVKKFM